MACPCPRSSAPMPQNAPRGIHKSNHRAMEFLCLLHQAQAPSGNPPGSANRSCGRPYPLCLRPFSDSDDRHRAAAERRDAADDRGVIRKTAVAVQLNEIRENILE